MPNEKGFLMDDKSIQQVLEIEKQAQEIHEAAKIEAEQLPIKAEAEAQALLDKTRREAEEEARKMISSVKAEAESKRIIAESEEAMRRNDALAKTNFDRAVAFVLTRIAGKE